MAEKKRKKQRRNRKLELEKQNEDRTKRETKESYIVFLLSFQLIL
jgi:high-affinity Fe2+/Pb2+ permease